MLSGGHHFGGIVGLPEHIPIHFHAPSRHQFDGPVKLTPGRLPAEKLSGLQITDKPVAQPHRHGGVEQPDRTGDRLRFMGGFFAKLFPYLQTSGARVTFLRHQRAKGIFVPLAMMRQLPGFHRLQRHRQTCQHVERALILLINLRIRDGFDQGAVVIATAIAAHRDDRGPGFGGRNFFPGTGAGNVLMEARLNQTILQGVGCRWRPFPPLCNGCLHGNKLSKPQTCVKWNGLA